MSSREWRKVSSTEKQIVVQQVRGGKAKSSMTRKGFGLARQAQQTCQSCVQGRADGLLRRKHAGIRTARAYIRIARACMQYACKHEHIPCIRIWGSKGCIRMGGRGGGGEKKWV